MMFPSQELSGCFGHNSNCPIIAMLYIELHCLNSHFMFSFDNHSVRLVSSSARERTSPKVTHFSTKMITLGRFMTTHFIILSARLISTFCILLRRNNIKQNNYKRILWLLCNAKSLLLLLHTQQQEPSCLSSHGVDKITHVNNVMTHICKVSKRLVWIVECDVSYQVGSKRWSHKSHPYVYLYMNQQVQHNRWVLHKETNFVTHVNVDP